MLQQPKTEPAFYARLRPFEPKRDQAMKVYVVGMRRFDAGVWVPVDAALAKLLRGVLQSCYDPLSPRAFEVLGAAEAKEQGVVSTEQSVPTSDSIAPESDANDVSGTDTEATARSPRNKKGREG